VSSPSVPSNKITNPETNPGANDAMAAGPESNAIAAIQLVHHGRLPLRLLLAINQVRKLFDNHSFWAQGRSRGALVRMLLGSCSVVSAWQEGRLVGIGRATSDGVFRAVLWDVVVAEEHQGRGLGRRIVQALLTSPPVAASERVYLMTTNSSGFYEKLGFCGEHGQQLLVAYRQGNQKTSG
jgi:ribosomal protein S18 acetylase RimI-like enzyme